MSLHYLVKLSTRVLLAATAPIIDGLVADARLQLVALKMRDMKLRDMKMRHKNATVKNARHGRCEKRTICRAKVQKRSDVVILCRVSSNLQLNFSF